MDWREHIHIDPAVRLGKPVVRGSRIAVEDVLSWLAQGMTEAQIVAEYPPLTVADVRAVLAFAADRERQTTFAAV